MPQPLAMARPSATITKPAMPAPTPPESEEDEGLRPIPDRLLTELTAHRTLALRHALGQRPDVAFLAGLHALALGVFYTYRSDSCLELDLKSVQFGSQAPGLNDTPLAQALDERHQAWRSMLPRDSEDLWEVLATFERDRCDALFAHCVSLSVNAVHEAWNRRPRAFAHADSLAQALDLDMASSWTPTAANFLGRVTKARIQQAVAEARGSQAAERLDHLKKAEMANEAEALLAGSGWLPEPLRTPGRAVPDAIDPASLAAQPSNVGDPNSGTMTYGEEADYFDPDFDVGPCHRGGMISTTRGAALVAPLFSAGGTAGPVVRPRMSADDNLCAARSSLACDQSAVGKVDDIIEAVMVAMMLRAPTPSPAKSHPARIHWELRHGERRIRTGAPPCPRGRGCMSPLSLQWSPQWSLLDGGRRAQHPRAVNVRPPERAGFRPRRRRAMERCRVGRTRRSS